MRSLTRSQIFDHLHRASVWALMGLTGFGLTIIGAYSFRYFVEVRPMQKELRQKEKEEGIRQEQMKREEELLRKQSEAEVLRG